MGDIGFGALFANVAGTLYTRASFVSGALPTGCHLTVQDKGPAREIWDELMRMVVS